MRRPGTWIWKVALLLGLSTAAAWAADKDSSTKKPIAKADEAKPGWFRRWVGRDETAKAPKATAKADKLDKADKAEAEPPPPKSQVEQATSQRKQEEDTLFRRLAVCDELMRIAMETQDDELMRKASQLNHRIMATYSQRIAHLPASNARFESDEKVLEKHLGAGTAVAPRQAGSPPYSNKGPDRSKQTAARGEVDE